MRVGGGADRKRGSSTEHFNTQGPTAHEGGLWARGGRQRWLVCGRRSSYEQTRIAFALRVSAGVFQKCASIRLCNVFGAEVVVLEKLRLDCVFFRIIISILIIILIILYKQLIIIVNKISSKGLIVAGFECCWVSWVTKIGLLVVT